MLEEIIELREKHVMVTSQYPDVLLINKKDDVKLQEAILRRMNPTPHPKLAYDKKTKISVFHGMEILVSINVKPGKFKVAKSY